MKDITNREIEVKCPECGITGRGSRQSHSGFSPRFSISENFYCEFCDARFTHWLDSPWELDHQYGDIEKEYQCLSCGRSYLVKLSEIRAIYEPRGKHILQPVCTCGGTLSQVREKEVLIES